MNGMIQSSLYRKLWIKFYCWICLWGAHCSKHIIVKVLSTCNAIFMFFVLVYFVLAEGSRTVVIVLVISFVMSTVCLTPSSERQTVRASPEDCILPTFMTSVSLGVPERGRAMWTRYLSVEGSWICYSDLITVTKIPDQKKLEEEFMLVSSLRDTVHHGEENMAAEAWIIWPLFIHSWEDGSNTFWCLV